MAKNSIKYFLLSNLIEVRLALRNTLRNKAHSLIAIIAIGVGVLALIMTGGFIDSLLWKMRENTITSRLGHIQIVKKGYLESGIADPFEYLLPSNPAVFNYLSGMPQVKTVTTRLNFSGLISQGETTMSFIGEAIEPNKEEELSRALTVTQGSNLSNNDEKSIIVGEGLAAILGIKPGDKVVLLANTKSGGINGIDVQVKGLFTTFTKAFDDAAIRIPINTAKQLLRVTETHSWVILLDKTESTPQVLSQLQNKLSATDLQLVPWFQLADFYNKTAALFHRQVKVVYLIIALVIVLSISNTLIMSVLERTGEIGTLMATGKKRIKILQMFILEGLILGVMGSIAGLVIAIPLAWFVSSVGIPMPPPPGSYKGFPAGIRLNDYLIFTAVAIAVVTSLVASIYPAWKASRLIIVDALRHNK